MQICIHRKDNSPKPVNHRLTLKDLFIWGFTSLSTLYRSYHDDLEGGQKVKSDIRRFPAHDILQFGFTLQTSRVNNKQVIHTFKVGCPCLTLKEGLKVKSEHTIRFPAHDFL